MVIQTSPILGPRPFFRGTKETIETKQIQRTFWYVSEKRTQGRTRSTAHECNTARAMAATTPASTDSATSAHAQRPAHLSSASRMIRTSRWRSVPDFEGSKSAGTASGEIKMMAPRTQKGGNTARRVGQARLTRDEHESIRTEPKFEEIHGQRDRLGVGVCRVRRELAVCIRRWWDIPAEGWV